MSKGQKRQMFLYVIENENGSASAIASANLNISEGVLVNVG